MATLTTPLKTGPGWELLEVSDWTFDFHVSSPDRYVLHCVPNVFGKPFISLQVGHNTFFFPTTTTSTLCYVWSEEQLAKILSGWEGESEADMELRKKLCGEPNTKPIPIPPRG